MVRATPVFRVACYSGRRNASSKMDRDEGVMSMAKNLKGCLFGSPKFSDSVNECVCGDRRA
jgi:hypothetical protein